jgi:hypothetical protein
MPGQPFQVSFPIDDFIDPGLEKQNRQEQRDRDLNEEQGPARAGWIRHENPY